jgi:hypothetical protein
MKKVLGSHIGNQNEKPKKLPQRWVVQLGNDVKCQYQSLKVHLSDDEMKKFKKDCRKAGKQPHEVIREIIKNLDKVKLP